MDSLIFIFLPRQVSFASMSCIDNITTSNNYGVFVKSNLDVGLSDQ